MGVEKHDRDSIWLLIHLINFVKYSGIWDLKEFVQKNTKPGEKYYRMVQSFESEFPTNIKKISPDGSFMKCCDSRGLMKTSSTSF